MATKKTTKKAKSTAPEKSVELGYEAYLRLAKKDFWTKTELYFVLFCGDHPIFHESIPHSEDPDLFMKSPRRLLCEEYIDKFDEYIDTAADDLKTLKKRENKTEKEFYSELLVVGLPIEDKFAYEKLGLLNLIQKKERLATASLIKMMRENRWEDAAKLMPGLHKNMVSLLNGKPLPVPETEPFTRDKTNRPAGRKSPSIKAAVIEQAKRMYEKTPGVSVTKTARKKQIVELLAKDARFDDLENIPPSEYAKRFGKKPRTVEAWIRESRQTN
ncbi:MAG: hypothetical protein ACE5G9_13280 [Nitrospinales bacterium]